MDFYRLDFSTWVNIVAVTKKQEIVFIQQYRFGSGQIEVEIPGGAVEPGEDPLGAGIRELLEETGYSG
jgi:8-oxo-dGTP pyrophosphatase MutT (NUDIX family)